MIYIEAYFIFINFLFFKRWATLGSCLYSTKDLFVAKDENNRSASSNFCLVDPNLWNIRPGHFGVTLIFKNVRSIYDIFT